MRNAFSVFANITADTRFNTSITLLENYGMQAVRAVNPASTALAPEEREYNVLASPVLWWDGEDENTAANAYGFVEKMRDALYMGVDTGRGKRHCYVNYANGNGGEDKRELYGYDGRVEKLVGLKKKWDVKGRFGFYNPFA